MQVNIIPVIAKADTLTPEECARFKKTVRTEREREREIEQRLAYALVSPGQV